ACEKDVDKLDGIGQIDGEAIAFLKAAIAQRVRQAIAALLDLAKGELRTIPFQADLVAPAEQRVIEEREEVHARSRLFRCVGTKSPGHVCCVVVYGFVASRVHPSAYPSSRSL